MTEDPLRPADGAGAGGDVLALLTPCEVGPLRLPNRVVMAPMTRRRAGPGAVPTALNATYYAQRAGAGLIVSEAAVVAPEGAGYPGSPGIHSDEQVEGWRLVTDAVHRAGGRIFLQLWHAGRVSHPDYLDGRSPVAPSPVAIDAELRAPPGGPFPEPRPLATGEVGEVAAAFGRAAARARDAGFDGVEIHAAQGYLIDQFLRDGTNRRTDRYGGSVEGRARFLDEVVEAVADAWDRRRIGVQLSPRSELNDMTDSDPTATFSHAVSRLSTLGVAYLHVHEMLGRGSDGDGSGRAGTGDERLTPRLADRFDGVFVVNGGYDRESGERAIRSGPADLVSYGRLFIANPDLPTRFARDAPLAEPDPSTFYGGGEVGYTDYPTLGEEG